MTEDFENVQRIVLRGSVWNATRHLMLRFPDGSSPLEFLFLLERRKWLPTGAAQDKPPIQVSLGFTRRGLERSRVPLNVMARFALKAPAFAAGAALRAASHLGATGRNAPGGWDEPFAFMHLDAVLSLHGMNRVEVATAARAILHVAEQSETVQVMAQLQGERLQPPHGDVSGAPLQQWTHFGYRDGLARIGIEGWPEPDPAKACAPAKKHPAGEFLLGRSQDSGANPWIAGPAKKIWPAKMRDFFRDGSFGVLHQIEQDVDEFERFVEAKIERFGECRSLTAELLKAKLCGRHPDGRPLAAPGARPEDDFDYAGDRHGVLCPFGSHVRRMNPRDTRDPTLAHGARGRPLLRRGMPYGAPWIKGCPDKIARGLFGHFFCASIEDQYEHLLGQWAERVPLGSADRGRARDPLTGAHEADDGAFEIPLLGKPRSALSVTGLRPFTQTRGIAYLFYPSLTTLQGIAENRLWREPDGDEDDT